MEQKGILWHQNKEEPERVQKHWLKEWSSTPGLLSVKVKSFNNYIINIFYKEKRFLYGNMESHLCPMKSMQTKTSLIKIILELMKNMN